MATNRYSEKCSQCGTTVGPGDGRLHSLHGKWIVTHFECLEEAPLLYSKQVRQAYVSTPQPRLERKPKVDFMNKTIAAFILNPNVRAISCIFELRGLEYTYKTLDSTIRKDDFVVVPGPKANSFKVVQVTKCDVDIDLSNNSINYKWIVCRVEKGAYEQILLEEAEA